jgi:two-component system, sensor histidine kinase and response regulator
VNQRLAMRQLLRLGFNAEAVGNGREAVDAQARENYDLIFMDVQMPVMDGVAATAAIRALPVPIAQAPIIAMTANAMAGDRELALAAGMDDHIAKPIEVRAMFETIARWVRPGVSADGP